MKTFIVLAVALFSVNLSYSQWEPDVRLTNDTAISSLCYNNARCIAVSGDSVHLVWYDKRDGKYNIYYKRSTDGGANWEADKRLTNDTFGSYTPSIAVSGSFVHVVWYDKRDSNYEIYYKRSIDGGANWEADKRLTNDIAYSLYPAIAVSGSFVHVVWYDKRDGNYEIYYKCSNDGGISWDTDKRLTNDTNGSYVPSIAVSGSFVHVVWCDLRGGGKYYQVYYKRSTDRGTNWGTDFRLNSHNGSYSPCLAVFDSFVHVVWNTGANNIYHKRSTDGGASWGSESVLNPYKSQYSSVAASGSHVHVVWEDSRSGNIDIYYKCSTDGGISWGADTLLSNNMTTMSVNPSIALSGSAVHIVWRDMRDGPNGEIYYKRNPTGNLFTGTNDLKIAKSDVTVYPNPFSENTNIEFEIVGSCNVEINIFNQTGIQIQTLKCESCQAGRNTLQWNCFDKNNKRVPGGVYYCKVHFGKEILVKKMIVVH